MTRSQALLLPIMLLAAPTAIQAQNTDMAPGDETMLEEVVVYAQRREQSIQDVPISITQFSGQDINALNINDITGVFNRTPNVHYVEFGAREERSISIRGISQFTTGQSAQTTYGYYIDGFNVAVATNNPHLQDIASLEVLRGPQGTYFGRNSVGGAINVVTNKPDNDWYAEADLGYSRDSTWQLRGTLNVPVVEDRFAIRASAFWTESDGFIRNVNPAGGRNSYRYWNARIAARITPSDRFTIDLKFDRTEDRSDLPSLIQTGVQGPFGAAIYGPGTIILDGLDVYPNNVTEVNHDLPEQRRNEYDIMTATIQYDFDSVTLTSITGYVTRDYHRVSDIDHSSISFFEQQWLEDESSISQEIRLHSTSGGAFEWLVGGLIAEDESNNPVSLVTFGSQFGPLEGFPVFDASRQNTFKDRALFAEVTWHASDQLSILLGGRYSKEKAIDPDEAGEPSVSFSNFDPRLSLTWHFNEDVSAYGIISRGHKAGGIQSEFLNFPGLPSDFDAEVVWNYEAGVKAMLANGRVRLNAAVFNMDWDDMQVETLFPIVDPETGQVSFLAAVTNAAKASSKGFELEMAAQATQNLFFDAGVGYTDATFDSFPNAPVFGEIRDLSGTRLPGAPKWTLNANGEYRFPAFDSGEAFVRAEWSYRSKSLTNFENDVLGDGFPWGAPAFDIWNFRAGLNFDRWRVTAFVENAFDEQYYTTSYDNGFVSGVGIQPSRRIYGVRLAFWTP